MMRKMLSLLAVAIASLAPAAQPDHVRLSRMTPGYTYFNRAGASMASHDADMQDCANMAVHLAAQDEQSHDGLIGALIAGAAHRGVVTAGIENCMVVRGWRVVALDDTTGLQWVALTKEALRNRLAPQVGAEAPLGQIVRQWGNDAAHAATLRYELRPSADGKQLSLLALPDIPEAGMKPSPHPIFNAVSVMPKPKPDAWDKIATDHALIIVKMKGVSPRNGVTLGFVSLPDKGNTINFFNVFQNGLSSGRAEGRFYVIDVRPGIWRLQSIHALSLCLGAPYFEVRPGDVLYAGAYDLSAENLGPDMAIEEARQFLAGHDVANRLKPAEYRNGATLDCGAAATIYALEVPGAPFDPAYHWGSRAAGDAHQ